MLVLICMWTLQTVSDRLSFPWVQTKLQFVTTSVTSMSSSLTGKMGYASNHRQVKYIYLHIWLGERKKIARTGRLYVYSGYRTQNNEEAIRTTLGQTLGNRLSKMGRSHSNEVLPLFLCQSHSPLPRHYVELITRNFRTFSLKSRLHTVIELILKFHLLFVFFTIYFLNEWDTCHNHIFNDPKPGTNVLDDLIKSQTMKMINTGTRSADTGK